MTYLALTLGEATAGERVARDRLTHAPWGDHLSLAQYLERETLLRNTEHGLHHMHTWVLRDAAGTIVASCETFRLPLLPGGAVEVIASVFVEDALRGRGLATKLINALAAHRREGGLDAMILFTEVGTTIYERSGFRVLPAPQRRWRAVDVADTGSGFPLFEADLAAALARRDTWREGGLELRLSVPILDWHFERARFYARSLGRPRPEVRGAASADAVAFFTPDFKNGLLRVLEASGARGANVSPLIGVAAGEARRLGLADIELWDDAHSVGLAGGAVAERTDDLPMILAFTPRGELFAGPRSRACWA